MLRWFSYKFKVQKGEGYSSVAGFDNQREPKTKECWRSLVIKENLSVKQNPLEGAQVRAH